MLRSSRVVLALTTLRSPVARAVRDVLTAPVGRPWIRSRVGAGIAGLDDPAPPFPP